jgi:DNA polymerase I-like protein with 3'-5' exonuclease and polymerase domains
MTLEELEAWKEAGAVLGATVMAAYLAWKARGRKERKELAQPYTRDRGAQPRVVSRKEWHDVVNLVNAIPGISQKLKDHSERLVTLEDEFAEHTRQNAQAINAFTRLETSFAAHVDRWEEVGIEAREHRQRLEAQLLRLEQKVDRH